MEMMPSLSSTRKAALSASLDTILTEFFTGMTVTLGKRVTEGTMTTDMIHIITKISFMIKLVTMKKFMTHTEHQTPHLNLQVMIFLSLQPVRQRHISFLKKETVYISINHQQETLS